MLTLTNLRRVTKSDENGERDAVVGDFCIDGADIASMLAADLAIPTQPSAADSRAIARPLAEAVQGLPS